MSLDTQEEPNESLAEYRQRLLFVAVRRAAKATERYFIAAGGTYSPDYPACEDVALDLLADWSAPDTREKAFYARFLLGSIPRDVEFYVNDAARRIRLRAVRVLWSNVGASWFSVGRNKDAALLQADRDDGNEMTTATKRRTKGALITKRDRGETLKVKNRDGNTGRYVGCPIADPPVVYYVEPSMPLPPPERYCRRDGWLLPEHTGRGPAPDYCGPGKQCHADRMAEDRKRQRAARAARGPTVCARPGCENPAKAKTGPGRSSKYCGDACRKRAHREAQNRAS